MKITEKPFSIPDHWQWVELQELAEINPTFDRTDLSDDDPVSFVPMKRVEELSGRIDLSETEPLSEVRKGYTYFEDGDVIFAKITPCMENGKVAVARGLENGVGFGSTEFHVIRHPKEATQEWIFHYLIQEGFRRDAKRAMTGSAGQKRVPTGYIEEVPIPLPPLPEQRRIVAKIEELLSNLDAGMDDLQAAEHQLERYRLSVLQSAVEGRLTADWRRTHEPEPADQLLERILEEHRKQWEVEYRWRRYDAKEKEPPSGWKSRYSPPESLEDESNLFSIPENWEWVRSEQICGFITKGTTPKSDKMYPGEGEVPFVKVYNLTETGELDFTVDPTFVDREIHRGKLARSRLLPGDVVMNIVGPPLGQVSVVPDDYPEWNMNQAVVRYRPLDGVDRRYLTYALRAKSILNWAIRKRKATAGQFNLTLAICRDLPIPLPPLAEQKQIVDEVERLLSVADDAATTAEREHTRAERLRQSILKQAFSGQLVPHEEGASPPSIDGTASEESDTGSSKDVDSDVEDLMGSADPSKQIEMDL